MCRTLDALFTLDLESMNAIKIKLKGKPFEELQAESLSNLDALKQLKIKGLDNVVAVKVDGESRDLLSPVMRIRERLAGGKPYKWIFELYHDGQWIAEEWCGLFFWNYIGKRTEKIYQNRILPAMENPVE